MTAVLHKVHPDSSSSKNKNSHGPSSDGILADKQILHFWKLQCQEGYKTSMARVARYKERGPLQAGCRHFGSPCMGQDSPSKHFGCIFNKAWPGGSASSSVPDLACHEDITSRVITPRSRAGLLQGRSGALQGARHALAAFEKMQPAIIMRSSEGLEDISPSLEEAGMKRKLFLCAFADDSV